MIQRVENIFKITSNARFGHREEDKLLPKILIKILKIVIETFSDMFPQNCARAVSICNSSARMWCTKRTFSRLKKPIANYNSRPRPPGMMTLLLESSEKNVSVSMVT